MNDRNHARLRREGLRSPRNHALIRCGAVGGNLRAPAFRVGSEFHWMTNHPEAERVILGVDPTCRFARDATGEVLVYRGRCPAWFPLTSALLLGWCWVAEPDNCGRRKLEAFRAGADLVPFSTDGATEPETYWLSDGTRCEVDGGGVYRFFRGEWGVGFPLQVALKEGWCRAPETVTEADLLPLGWDPLRGTAADRRRMTAA